MRGVEELDGDAPLGESAIEFDELGAGAVVPTWPGEPDVLEKRTGTEADSVCSEQRGHVVIVLVIKLVFTIMEVVPL